MLTNQPGDESWPITGATFILMHKQQKDPQKAKQVLDFFDWAYRNGDQMAEELHYVPMPDKVTGQVEEMWKKEIPGPGWQAGLDRPGLVTRIAFDNREQASSRWPERTPPSPSHASRTEQL